MKATASPVSLAGERLSPPDTSLPAFDFHPLSRVVYGAGTLARLGSSSVPQLTPFVEPELCMVRLGTRE